MYNIKFREIRINDAERILNWRTKERITRYMGSDINVSVKEQKELINKSAKQKKIKITAWFMFLS